MKKIIWLIGSSLNLYYTRINELLSTHSLSYSYPTAGVSAISIYQLAGTVNFYQYSFAPLYIPSPYNFRRWLMGLRGEEDVLADEA